MSNLLLTRADMGEFRRRFKWMALVVFLAFVVLLGRVFQLQIVQGEEYAGKAHGNVVRRVALPTTRGVIRDTQGKVLASSRPAYNVYLVPGRVMPSARPRRRGRPVTDEPDSWPRVADTLRLNPSERAYFENRVRNACVTDEDRSPCWRSILAKEDVARDIVAELRQHHAELAGAELVAVPVRYYPFKNLASHALGYMAEIDAETLAQVRPAGWENMTPDERQKVNPLGYEIGDTLGATGIERAWESYLRGQRGWEKRVVDARGRSRTGPEVERLLDDPKRQEPIVGRDLRLTLDVELTQAIEKAMRPHPSGAVVAVEVRTGRVLALYSKPDFDPNELSGGGGRARVREAFTRLYSDPLRPLVDKTTTGSFQPGSTFKPFSALAALENRTVDPEATERCDGFLVFGRRTFRCAHRHGKVDMHDALKESCNIYFAKVAESTVMDQIAAMANEFGLGAKTGIGINPESPGRIPTRAWHTLHYRTQFRPGDTLNMAIGQGAATVTPVQLALAYAAMANGGTVYSPQVIRAVETSDGSVVQDFPPRVRHTAQVKPQHLSRVVEALWAVVNESGGTVYDVRDSGLDVAGKTGTAQTGYVAKPEDNARLAAFLAQHHAWFAAFSPAKAPEVAVVVLVEHGGSGPTVAAPAALDVIREYHRLMATRAGTAPPPPKVPNKPKVPGAPAAAVVTPAKPAATPADAKGETR